MKSGKGKAVQKPQSRSKAVGKAGADVKEAFARERGAFKTLLLTNPNYFGNLKQSTLKAALTLNGNTFYEELACVGYHPQQERLEAVVYVKQPSGYGTDVCGTGTSEFVRFYLSFDNGATWQDQGLTSVQAYNIPGPAGAAAATRLEYAVSLKVDPPRKFCFFNPLIRVRAILSWNNIPPANDPNWTPIWGNVRESTILVEPRRFLPPLELFEIAKVKLPPNLQEVLDLDIPLQAKTKSLGAVELAQLYKGKDVPAHRFAFKELSEYASSKVSLSAESMVKLMPGIAIDPKIVDILFPQTDGDKSYEEMTCIGLDPNTPDTLVGVINVKKGNGYSGGPCTDGSKEYVTFWGDFDGNNTFETCLGTAEVRVYDLDTVTAGGVQYAVRLPVDLDKYRQACFNGARTVRIRAILSWGSPAPCSNPNHVPTWGNREETTIHITPTPSVPAGKIAILGGIPVSYIDNATGLTNASAVFATNNLPPDAFGRPCPFGGRVTVQGAPLPGFSYKVEVTPSGGGAPTAVVTKLVLTRFDGTTYDHLADPGTGRFDYVPFTQNINSVLAQWDTTGDDKWQVKLSIFSGGGILVGIDTHLIQLDNTAPEAAIEITSGPGNCGKFKIGDTISGTFVARDLYLGSYSIGVEPGVNPAGVGVPSPNSGLVNTAPAPGNAWSLNTTGMKPCGYVVRVVVVDRAIVNSQAVGHYSSDSEGFCLEKAS